MKAYELVVAARAEQRRKSRHGGRIYGFKLGKGVEIGLRVRSLEGFPRERLKRPQWLAAAAQEEIAHRSSCEIGDAARQALADADPRAQLLVCRLQPRGNIYCVAVSCVVEIAPSAEIPNNRRTGIEAETRRAEHHTFFFPAPAKLLRGNIELKGASNRTRCVIGLLGGGSEQHMHRV